MQVATVIGTATATIKHASMEGWKLLVVQVYEADGKTPDGDPLLAVDSLGAGTGERVMITSDGTSTRALLESDTSPVRFHVMGICDQ